MKEILLYLSDQNILSKEEARDIMYKIGTGTFSEAEIASFLTIYLMRKITPQELSGFREALLDLCMRVDLSGFNTIDVCGTGGDGKNTFNISTLSAFVIAGTGAKVVKHGNNAVSSSSGSSNIMEYYGYKFSNDSKKIRRELENFHISYLHAPLFHPAMKYVAPVRKKLKVKTFFNILGPMVNPAFPNNQLIGVFNNEVMELYGRVYENTGINHIILHSSKGFDEICLTGDLNYMQNGLKKIMKVQELGFVEIPSSDLRGGSTIEESAEIFIRILENKGTPSQNNVVIANAAMGLQCYYPKKEYNECLQMARKSLLEGNALKVFKSIMDYNKAL